MAVATAILSRDAGLYGDGCGVDVCRAGHGLGRRGREARIMRSAVAGLQGSMASWSGGVDAEEGRGGDDSW
jgi:hypothetical protein